jgi:tetrahydromethanopterin S-methyltransferase subunit H
MFLFTTEQKSFTIGNVKFGGQPGKNPTVLFGGLFFKGAPDIHHGKEQLQLMYAVSEKTGVPAIPDFFIKKEAYVEPIVTLINQTLPEHAPFSVDFTDPAIKSYTLQTLSDHNLLHRTIYNSIHVGITEEEYQSLTKWKPEMALVVAFNPKDTSPDGRIEVLETGAHLLENGLLKTAHDIGINKVLIDTAALAPGHNSGAAIASIPVVKEEYGLPTGCAIHNVVEKSTWIQAYPTVKGVIDVASNMNIPLFGGDFALFGPIEHSPMIFPMIAWQNMLISEYVESYFGITPSENHPRGIFEK